MMADVANAISLVVIQTAAAKWKQRHCWMVTHGELSLVPDWCERASMTEDEQETCDGCPQCEGE